MSEMDEPIYLYECQSCFRCVQECTKGIFLRVINPEYKKLGDDYWRPDIIHRTWYQAQTGKIPVSGAGYRGPFVGKGFDSMWTDMSEIVRPTRDGIHGREYINTTIELSGRTTRLNFNEDMTLASTVNPILEIPFPVIFLEPDFGILSEDVLLSAAKAAYDMGGMMYIRPESWSNRFDSYAESLIPCLTEENLKKNAALVEKSRMVEVAYTPNISETIAAFKKENPGMYVSIGIPLDANAAGRAAELAKTDADTLHFYADQYGNELNADNPRFLRELIREVHLRLIDEMARQKVNLIFSGGIAMAEHMAKAIICGADGVTVDIPLLIALECRLCYRCKNGRSCPSKLEEVDAEWGSLRIINLMAAWRNQLLEVMGAMGIREARRLRGEIGRSMWFYDLERENFGPIFGERKTSA
jgi:hypothetical protein